MYLSVIYVLSTCLPIICLYLSVYLATYLSSICICLPPPHPCIFAHNVRCPFLGGDGMGPAERTGPRAAAEGLGLCPPAAALAMDIRALRLQDAAGRRAPGCAGPLAQICLAAGWTPLSRHRQLLYHPKPSWDSRPAVWIMISLGYLWVFYERHP